jgi:hypothetical protein
MQFSEMNWSRRVLERDYMLVYSPGAIKKEPVIKYWSAPIVIRTRTRNYTRSIADYGNAICERV